VILGKLNMFCFHLKWSRADCRGKLSVTGYRKEMRERERERERERGGLRNKRSRVIREEKTNDIFCGTFGECIRYY
jgi:hypothetical protein